MLGQRVGGRKFISILSGCVPSTVVTLGCVINGKRWHRLGLDMTFSAPKSVSREPVYRGRKLAGQSHVDSS